MPAPEGWYHAQGDPEGTLRYWNGTAWIGQPINDPNASMAPPAPGAGTMQAYAGQPAYPSAQYRDSSFSFGRLFSAEGRINRVSYLAWIGVTFGIFFALAIVDAVAGTLDDQTGWGLFTGLGALAMIWPSVTMGVKRIHDWGSSGWWILLSLIPFVGFVMLLLFLFRSGNDHVNNHGPQPAPGVSF